jgi:hypothetical protein
MARPKKQNRITIEQLIDHLKIFDPKSELTFGSDQLTFYRTKLRGERLVQIEFNEVIERVKAFED